MNLYSLRFLMGEVFRDIRRSGLVFLAALLTLTFSLTVLGGVLFILYRLYQGVYALPYQFEIVAFVREDLPREETLNVQQHIAELPGVADVQLVTKEQAWAQMEEEERASGRSLGDALEGENPLPDRLDVRVTDPRWTARVADHLRTFVELYKVRDERGALGRVLALMELAGALGGATALLLFASAVLVVRNALRFTILARRQEIAVMELVGATPGFIRLPLVVEGFLYGALGGAVASGLVLLMIQRVSGYSGWFLSFLAPTLPPSVGPEVVTGVLMGIGLLVGLMGGTLSIRRFLRPI